jgi:hypothetical protein
MSWSSAGLNLVGEDERLWTIEDAARYLGSPSLTATQVRHLIAMTNMQPVGQRRPQRLETRGRAARVYRAIDLIRAHDALSRAA